MESETKELLELLLVAQVLTLAKTIEAEKRERSAYSTTHYVPEAVALIRQQRGTVVQLLAQIR